MASRWKKLGSCRNVRSQALRCCVSCKSGNGGKTEQLWLANCVERVLCFLSHPAEGLGELHLGFASSLYPAPQRSLSASAGRPHQVSLLDVSHPGSHASQSSYTAQKQYQPCGYKGYVMKAFWFSDCDLNWELKDLSLAFSFCQLLCACLPLPSNMITNREMASAVATREKELRYCILNNISTPPYTGLRIRRPGSFFWLLTTRLCHLGYKTGSPQPMAIPEDSARNTLVSASSQHRAEHCPDGRGAAQCGWEQSLGSELQQEKEVRSTDGPRGKRWQRMRALERGCLG
ncbi:uncharacterized protein [Equus caballus]|uniref:uncharacterized protein n=1 Tax=Equus caballus TaxID=9796 RepID=UPI0038B4102D